MFQISSAGRLFSIVIVAVILFFTYITSVNSSALQSRQKSTAQSMRNEMNNTLGNLSTEKANLTSNSQIADRVKTSMLPINRSDTGSYRALNDLQDEHNKNKNTTIATPVKNPQNGLVIK